MAVPTALPLTRVPLVQATGMAAGDCLVVYTDGSAKRVRGRMQADYGRAWGFPRVANPPPKFFPGETVPVHPPPPPVVVDDTAMTAARQDGAEGADGVADEAPPALLPTVGMLSKQSLQRQANKAFSALGDMVNGTRRRPPGAASAEAAKDGPRGMYAGTLPRAAVLALCCKGLVYCTQEIGDEDIFNVPPLQGFVMNRNSDDPLDKLFYDVLVSIDERTPVSALASMLVWARGRGRGRRGRWMCDSGLAAAPPPPRPEHCR